MLTMILSLLALASFALMGMAIQLSGTVRDNQNDQIEATIGTSARLRIYTGAAPANCAAAATGTLLATLVLPSDWMGVSAAGVKAKAGTWSGTAGAGAGSTPGYFRLYDSTDTTCGLQGTAGIGSGDLSFDGTITSGQTITISTFSLTAGGA